jgi:hypothetical protein
MDGEIVAQNNYVQEVEDSCLNYGKYVQRSMACPVCTHSRHNAINLMRAKEFKTYKEMSAELGNVSEKILRRHFEHHYIISAASQKLLDLKENTSPAAVELVRQIMEEDLDLVAGAKGVMKSKAMELSMITRRLEALQEAFDVNYFDDLEDGVLDNTEMFIKLCRAKKDVEKSLLDTYKILDDKFFQIEKSLIKPLPSSS